MRLACTSLDTDIEQIGRLALAQACERFDEGREASFPTYARMRIRGAMIDAIRGHEFREASRERDAVRIDALPGTPNIGKVIAMPAREPWIERAIATLPARQARIIELRYNDELTQLDAARQLGISRTTAAREVPFLIHKKKTR